MTSHVAICWTSSAECGGTCLTPASVISEGRTQVNHYASLVLKLNVVFGHKCAVPVTTPKNDVNTPATFQRSTKRMFTVGVTCLFEKKKSVKLSIHVCKFPFLLSRPAPQCANSPDGQLPRLPQSRPTASPRRRP